jgi:putative PIN family toxin of toxin-antitoxin system
VVRLVLDTHILISSLLRKHTAPYMLYWAWRDGRFDLVTLQPQLDELRRVLTYCKLQRYVQPEEVQYLLTGIGTYALCVPDIPEVDYSSDPDDNRIIATAIAGHAQYLVSGDKSDSLTLKAVGGIQMVTARQALDVLSMGHGS